jgi:hypothetical protein
MKVWIPLALILAAMAGEAWGAEGVETSTTTADPEDRTMADNVHSSVDNFVQDTVRRVDGFFVNSEYGTFSDRKTRVRLRLDTDYIQHHGFDVSPKIKLNLVLPGLNERLRLVVNDDQGSDGDQASATDDGDNDIALRWIGRQRDDAGISFDLGLRIKDGDLDPFARVNAGIEYPLGGKWVGQTTNRLYYYAKTAWRNDLRQYFNRAIGEDFLLRSRTRIQYFDENGYNPFVEQKFSLFQSLSPTRKLAYEALYRLQDEDDSPFDTDEVVGDPKEKYQHFILQLRYRQQLWRPWFYVEVWPAVAWPEERDYETTFGGRLRLEINLGDTGDQRLDE